MEGQDFFILFCLKGACGEQNRGEGKEEQEEDRGVACSHQRSSKGVSVKSHKLRWEFSAARGPCSNKTCLHGYTLLLKRLAESICFAGAA